MEDGISKIRADSWISLSGFLLLLGGYAYSLRNGFWDAGILVYFLRLFVLIPGSLDKVNLRTAYLLLYQNKNNIPSL